MKEENRTPGKKLNTTIIGIFLLVCAVVFFVFSFSILPGLGILLSIIFLILGVLFLAIVGR